MKLLAPVKHPKLQAAERLETEICELAAHLAAATCRFLILIAEFDRLDGWLGHRSCAQWLSWRCGLSNSTAREHVRVAHALERFPVIREAFARGRLSYSKVRAITRVAHSGNEAELVETALVTTAAQLDRIVRAMRTATPQQVRDRHRDRALSWWWDDDGMLRISVRLDPDEGAAALAALRAACSAQPHPTADGTPTVQRRERSPDDGPQGGSAVRPHATAASGTTASPAAELAAGPRTAGASAKQGEVEAVTGMSAGEVSTKPPAVEAAAELNRAEPRIGTDARGTRGERSSAGPASASAEAHASLPAYQEAKTSLADAFGAIMRSYLGSVARDASETEAFQVVVLTQITGAADAAAVPAPGDETAASVRGEGGRSSAGGTAPSSSGGHVPSSGGGTAVPVRGEVGPPSTEGTVTRIKTAMSSASSTEMGAAEKGTTEKGSNAVPVAAVTGGESVLTPRRTDAQGQAGTGRGVEVPGTEAATGGLTDDAIPLPPKTVLRIACTAPIVHAVLGTDHTPMDIGRKSRKVGTALRRALRFRDAGRCRFPGCSSRRRLHAHHVRHWADGGETALANLISLCPAHHRAVHEGGHRVWVDETGRVRFARPDGRLMEPAPPMGPADGGLVTADERVPAGAVPLCWDGTPLDLDHAVLALSQPALAEPGRAEADLIESAGRSRDETGRLPGIRTRLSSEATSCRAVTADSAA